MTSKTPATAAVDELFERAAERTMALGDWLDESTFAALVDYVRTQLLAAAQVQRGSAS